MATLMEEYLQALIEEKKWIQKAIEKPGALHKALDVPKGEKIPKSKLKVKRDWFSKDEEKKDISSDFIKDFKEKIKFGDLMKVLSGSFSVIEFCNEIKQFTTFVFRIKTEGIILSYRTLDSLKVSGVDYFKLQVPVPVFESVKLKQKFFNNYTTIKLGKFDGLRYNLPTEPKVFSFVSNILPGRWEIKTVDEKKNLPQHFITRISLNG